MVFPKYIPHYTIAEYQQWEGDWELWYGIPVAMTPSPFGIHQWLSGQFAHMILGQMEEQRCADCFLVQDVDWIIREDLIVRPDVSLVCGELPEKFIETVPKLVIEILSESTADKDRQSKRDLYAQLGVKFYGIVDPWKWECEILGLKSRKYNPLDVQASILIHRECSLQLRMPKKPAAR